MAKVESLPTQLHVPPQNLEAEESVLGAMLLTPKAIELVQAILEPDDFYRTTHGDIYRTALSMHLRGEPVDVVTMGEMLGEDHKAILHTLAALMPVTGNVVHYAKIVKEKARQRNTLRALSEATRLAHEGELDSIQEILSDIDRKPDETLQIVSMANALVDLEEEVRNPPEVIGIDTPFTFIKSFVGGRVYIFAGYQGEGKTALMGQIVQHSADRQKKVGVFTLEMTWRDLRDRCVAAEGVPYEEIQERRFKTEWSKTAYEQALTKMALWQVEMIDKGDLRVSDIARVCKLREYDIICIDHLHRFDWSDRRDLERIVAGIVNIAKAHNIPVILLAQLKRPFGTDRLPRPTMSMLRESGMIEAEAAMCAFVYRPRNDQGLRGMDAELVIAKNRYGEEGLHRLMFLGEQQRFIEPL